MKGIKKVLLGGAALLVVALTACTPPPTTPTSTTTTTTTAAPSGLARFDFNDQWATFGVGCTNCLNINLDSQDGLGHEIYISVKVQDTNQAADGGYSWYVTNAFVSVDESGAQDCHYPLVQVRGRANIGDGTSTSTTYRMDFDGYDTNRITLRDLAGPWDFSSGDLPNVFMESVTVDTSSPICQPIGGPGA